LLNRSSPKKRKQPEDAIPTQRLTRSQAKKRQAMQSEYRDASGGGIITAIQPTQLVDKTSSPRKKLKTTFVQHPAQSKAASGEAIQAVNRSSRKTQKPNAVARSSKNSFIEPGQLATGSPKKASAAPSPDKKTVPNPARSHPVSPPKQKQLIVVLPNLSAKVHVDNSDSDLLQISAADRVKMSPRKAAKTSASTVIPKSSSARQKKFQATAAGGPSAYDRRADATEDNLRSSSRTMSPDKSAVSGRIDSRAQPGPLQSPAQL
jgi:hypothetical protein